MTVSTINTFYYEFTHGKAPRGEGHWAFRFYNRMGGLMVTEYAPGKMTCGAAKKWAIARANAIGADRVEVAT